MYCFTHMPKGLKKSATTLQRMMDKVLGDQKGRNAGVYLEERVIKSRCEESLIKDIEETLDKLLMVNVKTNPSKCTFKMKEGNLLGYVVKTEGIKVNPEKLKVKLRGLTPRGPNEIRTLYLQLTSISMFIPKMAELMLSIRNVQKNLDAAKAFDWTSEATEAFQKIRRRLAKQPTLTMPKEGEVLMVYLRPRNEMIIFVLLVERNKIQMHISYVTRPLQGIENSYTSTEKAVLALVHTERSFKTTFRKYQIRMITDRSVEEMLKLLGTEGRLAKWTAELRTYHVSYIQRKEVEGQVVKKILDKGNKYYVQ
nr:hypothetical protein [Tanacetum cinerariifolium]